MRCKSFIMWPLVVFHVAILLITKDHINAQEVLLESTIVRCSQDEMLEDGTPKNPLLLASSFKSINLKFYSKCRKKLLITLRVTESLDNFVPDALILIDRAKNVLTQKSSRFGLPIAVKFHQEALLQSYTLKYLYRVNGKMYEEVINSENSNNYTDCSNNVDNSGTPTCGFLPGVTPKQTAGFCCSCQDHKNNVQQRGGQRCDIPHKTAEQLTSAHCLRSSPYWYNVYEIYPPTLYQKITFEIFKSKEFRNGSIFWERMSENGKGVQVDSITPTNAAGAMKVTYRPHVEGIDRSAMLFDSSHQRLLFPLPNPYVGSEQFPEPDPLKGPIEDQILIIPKSLMSPHGSTCDRVGTQIDAFLNQAEPCRQEKYACLKNQPFDLWKQDQGPRGDPKSRFRLNSYQTERRPLLDFADDYKSGAIYVEHKADAPTYVDIEIPADDIVILAPGYNAFIESVLTDTGSEGSKIVTQVFNKELVEAAFTVELVQCNLNLNSHEDDMSVNVEMKSSQKKIGPLSSKYFYLDLHSYALKLPIYCYVILLNEYGEYVAAREVTLKPHETCLCVHTCKCACGENTNVKCEKMSEENIVATGLISTIKTAAQIEEEEKSHFTRKYRWIFHWILVFHIVLLLFAFCGWLQKHCRKPLPEKRRFPRTKNEYDELNSSGSSDTSEVTLFNKDFPSNSKLLAELFDSKPNVRSNDENLLISKSTQIMGDMSSTTTAASQEVSKSTVTSQRDINGVSNKVTFASQPQFKAPSISSNATVNTIQSSVQSIPIPASKVVSSKTQKTAASKQPSIHSVASSPNQSMTSSPQGSKTIEQNAGADIQSPAWSATDQSIITTSQNKSNSSKSDVRGQHGPQAADSEDLWINNDENGNDIDSFVNYCVSASSSKTSFGTWHRKRRDQYSAYDFLPVPKQKGSFN